MGLLCCHILKIMDHLDVKKIPDRHILKRWTRDARDVLPDHLAHCTCRHSHLYLQAFQLVRMVDTSVEVEAYEKLTSLFNDNIVTMQPYTEKADGLGEGKNKRRHCLSKRINGSRCQKMGLKL